jgi:hypothetical protein
LPSTSGEGATLARRLANPLQSHIATPSIVKGYTKDDNGLETALKGADVVVIPAGVPRKVV